MKSDGVFSINIKVDASTQPVDGAQAHIALLVLERRGLC